jgi:hypothetical protein
MPASGHAQGSDIRKRPNLTKVPMTCVMVDRFAATFSRLRASWRNRFSM